MQAEFSIDLSGCRSLDLTSRQRRLDRRWLTDFARAVEAAGIDRLLLADRTGAEDVVVLASYILHATSALGLDVQHRAGALDPENAARQIATLDQLSGGRLGVQVMPPDGESLSHEQGLARLDEFLVLLKRLWANDSPIDHEGRFHRLKAAFSAVKPFHAGSVSLVLAGVSGTAVKVAARHADRFLLPAASIEESRRTIDRVKTVAASFGRARNIRFALPVRPSSTRFAIAASLEPSPHAEAMPITGSPEKVALALLDYCDVGVTDFVVGGLATPNEVAAFGATVVPLVRRTLAHREGNMGDRLSVRPTVLGNWQRTA